MPEDATASAGRMMNEFRICGQCQQTVIVWGGEARHLAPACPADVGGEELAKLMAEAPWGDSEQVRDAIGQAYELGRQGVRRSLAAAWSAYLHVLATTGELRDLALLEPELTARLMTALGMSDD
jgi:hypothetical protein